MSESLSIGEVADLTGMSVHALRYYERHGLLAVDVERTASGHRRYTADGVEWIEVCRQLRRSGMSLKALREYTDLVRAGPGNEQRRLDLLRRHQSSVRAEIDQLRASLDLITYKVDLYQQHVAYGSAATTWAH